MRDIIYGGSIEKPPYKPKDTPIYQIYLAISSDKP